MTGGGRTIRRIRAGRLALLLLLLAALVLGGIGLVRWGLDRYYRSAYPLDYSELVDAACAEKQLDRAFVYALIRTESGFRPDAVSEVGARGLMQMMPDALDWVAMRKGVDPPPQDNLFDPAFSVEYGTSMLRLLFDEFKTEANVLCGYHAGWGSVRSWLQNPEYAPDGETVTKIPFRDTAHYVDKVLRAAEMYRKLYDL